MPYTEFQDEIPKDDRPIIRKFRVGDHFSLAVYNFGDDLEVPLIGFSIEGGENQENLHIDGSTLLLDPAKVKLTKPTIAVAPLLHIFNADIEAEARKAANLITKVSGKQAIVSLAKERDKRMMDAALNATHNVMLELRNGEETEPPKQLRIGAHCLNEKLDPAIDASSAFYDALMNSMRDLFKPAIRSLAEDLALNDFHAK